MSTNKQDPYAPPLRTVEHRLLIFKKMEGRLTPEETQKLAKLDQEFSLDCYECEARRYLRDHKPRVSKKTKHANLPIHQVKRPITQQQSLDSNRTTIKSNTSNPDEMHCIVGGKIITKSALAEADKIIKRGGDPAKELRSDLREQWKLYHGIN